MNAKHAKRLRKEALKRALDTPEGQYLRNEQTGQVWATGLRRAVQALKRGTHVEPR